MKLSKKMIFALLAVVTLSGSVFAYSKFHYDSDYYADRIVKKISGKLELNDVQQVQLVKLRDTIMQARKEVHKSKAGLQSDIENLISQDTLDRQFVLDRINQRADVMRVKAPDIVNAMGDFYDSLNPEQLQKLRKHINHKMEHLADHYDDD